MAETNKPLPAPEQADKALDPIAMTHLRKPDFEA